MNTRIAVQVLSAFVVVIGLVVLFGYASGQELWASWNGGVGMAIPTAICMINIGTALFLLTRNDCLNYQSSSKSRTSSLNKTVK